ncbi:MAG TPA: type VI secretion system tip protein VgrG [Sedimentisphaerales bacterium]|nr:type VI secretion system tip protein VgrG [Sedimentisphaerales bacterium]
MSVVTVTILSQDEQMDPAYEILSLDIIKEINRIPQAQLMLVDGDAAQRNFSISDTAFFEPGKEIEIKLRYEGTPDETVFKGPVVRHGVQAGESGSVLTVEMKDAAVKLTHTRKSIVFREQTDHEIIDRIIQDAGLEKGSIEATEPKHPEIVQYYATDWDFILSRADIQGLIVIADDGNISLQKIAVNGQPKLTFEWGISEIYNFEIEVDASHQYSALEGIAWDLKKLQRTQARQAEAFELSQGNLDGGQIAQTIGFDTYRLTHPVPLDTKELQAWVDARMARSRMSMIRGRIAVAGFADIKPLDVIEVKGIGERFNGKTFVTGIRQKVNDSGWQTDIQFGLSPDWFCRQENIEDVPAAGLLPGVSGLQLGIVDAFEKDPEKEYRVKVILPAIDEENGAVWARLLSPDAGKDHGYFFRPETGDEVVVGFFNNDPRQPVILGAMYGSKNTPPEEVSQLTEKNIKKAIVTKKGTKIGFVDEEKASVFIETPESNKIVFDDDAQMIQVTDQHGNSITMDKNGIEIKSAKDVKIDASGNVQIKGQKVDVK